MSEFWIVCGERHEEHETRAAALAERERLARYVPERAFKVHRCKRSPHSAQHFPKMVELLQEILRDGLTRETRERADMLLYTIGNRSGLTFLKDCSHPEAGR